MELFKVITGSKIAYNPDLKKVLLLPLNEIKESTIEIIKKQLYEEFKIETEVLDTEIESKRAIDGGFINTAYLSRELERKISYNKSIAIMGISKYWLSPTGLLLSRIIHTFSPIIGLTYLESGICVLTTLKGKIPKHLLKFAIIHEVGHLLGKHGYPLRWLKEHRKEG
ncbi:MAG: hypothetical protein EU549_04340 [Promethearchaeota archaeon]|nr:MAG: hypothetical protein EU549_04340 [Candidatus Lokiarchaeota archaeon]